jgi:uncharacterized protein (TIGR02246 family)
MFLNRRLLPLLLALPLAAAPPESEGAIRQLIQQYLVARDRNDAAALSKLFLPGSDQLVSNGEWRKGTEAVVEGTLATSRRTGGNRSITIETVRFLTPDAALADGRYDLTGLSGSRNLHMWSTFVLVRTAEGWRIAAIRNMLPASDTAAK